MEKELNLNIQGITFGFSPNYSGQIEFLKDLGNQKKAVTQIQFYVSLLENVYTMQMLEIDEQLQYNSSLQMTLPNHVLKEIWVSPENHEYQDVFLKIKSYLSRFFNNPFYLPYSIQQTDLQKIGLTYGNNREINNLGDAFFRKVLPLNQIGHKIFGNQDYEIEQLR